MGSWDKPGGERITPEKVKAARRSSQGRRRDRLEGRRRQFLHVPGGEGMETDTCPGEDGNLLQGFQPGVT